MSSCEKMPTQAITKEPVEKVAVATISEVDRNGLTGTATFGKRTYKKEDGVGLKIH